MTQLYYQANIPGVKEFHAHLFETKDNLKFLNELITDATDNTTLSDEIIARNKKLIWILREHETLIERIKEYLLFFLRKTMSEVLIRGQTGECCALSDEWYKSNIDTVLTGCNHFDLDRMQRFILFRFNGTTGAINDAGLHEETCHEENMRNRNRFEEHPTSSDTKVFDVDALPSIESAESIDLRIRGSKIAPAKEADEHTSTTKDHPAISSPVAPRPVKPRTPLMKPLRSKGQSQSTRTPDSENSDVKPQTAASATNRHSNDINRPRSPTVTPPDTKRTSELGTVPITKILLRRETPKSSVELQSPTTAVDSKASITDRVSTGFTQTCRTWIKRTLGPSTVISDPEHNGKPPPTLRPRKSEANVPIRIRNLGAKPEASTHIDRTSTDQHKDKKNNAGTLKKVFNGGKKVCSEPNFFLRAVAAVKRFAHIGQG